MTSLTRMTQPGFNAVPYPIVFLNPQQHLMQVENKRNKQYSYMLFNCNRLSVLRLKRKYINAAIKVYDACSMCYHADNYLICSLKHDSMGFIFVFPSANKASFHW